MEFNTYGDINKPVVILMHGMCQHWKSMYDFMHKLEEKYYLIIPGMDGYYGVSQGTLVEAWERIRAYKGILCIFLILFDGAYEYLL